MNTDEAFLKGIEQIVQDGSICFYLLLSVVPKGL